MPYCYRCAFDCTDGCRNCGQQYAAELERAIDSYQRRGRRLHLRAGQRRDARRSRSSARISAVHRRNLPPPRRAAHRRRSHDRHGSHWPQLRSRALEGSNARHSGHRQRTLQRIRPARRRHRQQESRRRHRRWLRRVPARLHLQRASHFARRRTRRAAISAGKQIWSKPPTPVVPALAAAHFKQALESLRNEAREYGDVRGIGLLWAVEFVADKPSKRPFPPEQNFRRTRRRRRPEARPARLSHARQRRRHLRAITFFWPPRPSSRRTRLPGRSISSSAVDPRSQSSVGGHSTHSVAVPGGSEVVSPPPTAKLISAPILPVFNRLPNDLRLTPA